MTVSFAGLVLSARAESPKIEPDFKWFSGLGFPDVAGCPYARIADGGWTQSGAEAPPKADDDFGFLRWTNRSDFRVLTIDLMEETLTNCENKTNDYKNVGFKTLDLKGEADRIVQSAKPTQPEGDYWSTFAFAPTLAKRAELFVLGWSCWRNGLTNEAERLYKRSQMCRTRGDPYEATNTFHELIEKDIACVQMWRATLCFGDMSFSRPQLLAMFDAIATNYPDSEYHARAAQTSEMLRKMIAEDELHAQIAKTNREQLSVAAQVRELIFELRDQNGHQYSQPGECDIFNDWSGGNNTNTPAHRLVRLGYAAVPQLIAALDDPTLTRSVGYWRDFVFSHNVLTVGDCCQAILKRITGKSFFVPVYTSSYTSKDDMAAATKKAAEAWWAAFQKKGEKQMLVDEVSSPGNDAPDEAKNLCRKYPDAAVPALILGIQAATNEWIQSELVEQLGAIGGPESVNFLTREMTNSPALDVRIAAAYVIKRTNQETAVTAMMGEWNRYRSPNPWEDDGRNIADFLARSDSPEAIAALAQGMHRRTIGTRIAIILDFDPESLDGWVTNSPATRAAIEALLVNELGDTQEQTGYSGSMNGKDFFNPRACDMAGLILTELFTNRYAFNFSATRKVRDQQRIECINVWRQAHHQPRMPLPAETSTHVRPEQAAWVTAIEWADDSVKPAHEFAEKIAAFKGGKLEATNVIELLRHYAIAPEPNSGGFEFHAFRDEDLTGVKLVVCLIRGRQLTVSQMYHIDEGVVLGRNGLVGMSAGGQGQYFAGPGEWSYLAGAINQVVSSSPQTPFEISVRISSGTATDEE